MVSVANFFPHWGLLYDKRPTGRMQADLLIKLADERMLFLSCITAVNELKYQLHSKLYMDTLNRVLRMEKFEFFKPLGPFESQEEELQQRFYDNVSHLIIRCGYDEIEDKKAYLNAETTWFRIRFRKVHVKDHTDLIRAAEFNMCIATMFNNKDLINALAYEYEDDNILTTIKEALSIYKITEMTQNEFFEKYSKHFFYRVHFTSGHRLISEKLVVMLNSVMYVPLLHVDECFGELFKKYIQNEIEKIVNRDLDALIPYHIKKGVGNTTKLYFKNSNGLSEIPPLPVKFNVETVKQLKDCFPLCMLQIQEDLEAKNIIKYTARLQYILFLKIIGVPLNSALQFFQESFMLSKSEFTKQKYEYFIRHLYGTVGSKVHRTPFSCEEMQNTPVEYDRVNGCPYVNLEPKRLKTVFKRVENCSASVISDIEDLMDKNKPCKACKLELYKLNGVIVNKIVKPEQFFEKSFAVTSKEKEKFLNK